MTVITERIEATEGRDAEVLLTFLQHSFPLPQMLTYDHDGQTVVSNDRISTLSNGSVRILNPTRTDSGNYTLTIANSYGTASGTISLAILCKCEV